MTTDARSPDEIERDLEQRRRHVESTIEALQDRLSPGQLVDQAIGYAREGGGEFGGNFAQTVRENPVPVTLIGAGLAWLAAASLAGGSGRPRRYERDGDEDDWMAGRYRDVDAGELYGSDTVQRAGELHPEEDEAEAEIAARDAGLARRLGEVRTSITQRADESAEAFQQRLYQARGQALDMHQRANESASDFRGRIDQRIADLGTEMDSRRRRAGERMAAMRAGASGRARRSAAWAGDSARGTRDGVVRRGRATGRAAASLLDEQPLLVGLLGCAVGAGLAALLPVSRREDELFGQHRDRLLEQGEDAAQDALERAGRVGERTAKAADAQARREGLTQERAQEAGHDLAGRVGRVAETTVETAREEGRHQAGQPAGSAGPGHA